MRFPPLFATVACALMVVMLPQVTAKRYLVGKHMGGWTSNVNYTVWAKDKHFYLEDWLYFVYDRNQMSVLEVNKTNYETCNSDHLLGNYTTGAGRDVVELNVTGYRYFISGNGFCYGGMKLAVHTVKKPSPPKPAPVKSYSPTTCYKSQFIVPLAFAVGIVWDFFLNLMG
ncbi:hypothetical protein BVRB_4g085580 [Beta vulgaris subsp. vulgaris]|nr:hypothetical protein BVRB_4g085580 [Beta vulgaris subsp. vulgaris]